MAFPLPPKSEVGVLDPSIAGEGIRVFDNGEVNWTPPPERLVMPDLSMVKKIRKYFNRKDYHIWPAYLYHDKTDEVRLVKDAEDASELGIGYRATSSEERMKFGKEYVWDWEDGCHWRPFPGPQHGKFDTRKPGTGKIYVAPTTPQQGPSMEATVAAVLAAVSDKMQPTMSMEAMVAAVVAAVKASDVKPLDRPEKASDGEELNANSLSTNQEREFWVEEAVQHGIKVDGRWSASRIKSEIDKKAA